MSINQLRKHAKIQNKNLDSGASGRMVSFPSIRDLQTNEGISQVVQQVFRKGKDLWNLLCAIDWSPQSKIQNDHLMVSQVVKNH